ncbi:helix-turn-helix domain-containing protein [Streptomyces sp. NPDC054883]
MATLVHLRHATTHDFLACWFGVDRSTITRAIAEVRPLFAERGCTIATDIRLRTLAEVIDHLGAGGRTGIIDGTEVRVRRPAAGRKDRDKFISGKLCRHYPRPTVGPGQEAPDQRTLRDPRDAGYQGLGANRRRRRDTTTPQVQEEPTGLVRRDARTPAQGTLLTPYPCRARHRTPQELASPRTAPRPPRAHERHDPSRRRTALTPAAATRGPVQPQ